nr:hypothetical protein [uncultured Serratia sp.]
MTLINKQCLFSLKNIIILLVSFICLPSQANTNKAKSVQDTYVQVVNKIITSNDCFSDEIALIKPRLLDGGEPNDQTFNTRFNPDIFVDFYADNGVVNGATITALPVPNKPEETLRFICIAAAVQSTIDSTRSINEFKRIDQDKFLLTQSEKSVSYKSKYFEHAFSIDSTGMIVQIGNGD